MSVEWLAAVLQPQDVAPHPNFSGSRRGLPQERLAAFLTGDSWRWRYVLGDDTQDAATNETTIDDTDAETAISCFDMLQMVPSISKLRKRLESAVMPPAKRVALTLVLCAAASEIDDYKTCFSILKATSAHLDREPRSSDTALLQAVIWQQWAFRLYDCGEDHHGELLSAFEHLQRVKPEACTSFPMSLGASRTYVTTVTAIKANLTSAMESLVDFDNEEWARQVGIRRPIEAIRGEVPPIVARIDHLDAENYAALDLEKYQESFSTHRSRRFGHASKPDLYFSLLALELLGSAWSHRARSRLAIFRIMRGLREPEAADALRLLRQGFDKKNLELFIQRLRLSGPLDFLSRDARQILRNREWKHVRVPELMVIAAAGELLVAKEASRALDLVKLVVAHGGPRDTPHEWQADVLRDGAAWEAALSVAASCERIDETALWLLGRVRERDDDPQLLDRALATAFRDVDWTQVSIGVRQAWKAFVDSKGADFQGLRDVLSDASSGERAPIAASSLLEQARQLLNQQARGALVAPNEYTPYVPAVIQALTSMREEAAKGQYSRQALSPTEIAALILLRHPDERLAGVLTDVLLDRNVAPVNKARAFDRLAHRNPPLSGRAKDAFLANHVWLLMDSGLHLWDSQLTPNPGVLRFLAASETISSSETFLYLSMLLDGTVQARREAARTLVTLIEHRFEETWVVLSLALTRDEDRQTRAIAARALVIASGHGTAHVLAVRDALRRLLADDGLMGPFYVLDSLGEMTVAIDHALLEEIREVAERHPSRRVRERAKSLMAR